VLRARGIDGGKFMAIHPGSGSPKKNWSPEGFVQVARSVCERTGMKLLVVSGPAEDEDKDAGALRAALAGLADAWLGRPGLTLLAGVLAHAAVYLGNDSGVSHLAAAVGAPTVAVFGPTDPTLWAPRGRCVRVLRAASGRLADVEPPEVTAAVLEMIS
jgi:ADP-heptose:LPS heptosyltransferase